VTDCRHPLTPLTDGHTMSSMRGKWFLAVLPIALVVGCASSGPGSVAEDEGVIASQQASADPATADPGTAVSEAPPTTDPPVESSALTVGQPANLDITTTNRLDGSTADSSVTITVDPVNTPTVSADGFGDTPQNGLFIVTKVHFQVTSGSLDYNLFNFQLQLPDGTVYQPGNGNALSAGIDPTLDSGNLTAGQQVAGFIVFDANAPHGTINYKPSDSIIASWNY
jgi:hypothetical protein